MTIPHPGQVVRGRELEEWLVGIIEGLYHDPDLKLRRRARKLLAHHRRTGKLNIL